MMSHASEIRLCGDSYPKNSSPYQTYNHSRSSGVARREDFSPAFGPGALGHGSLRNMQDFDLRIDEVWMTIVSQSLGALSFSSLFFFCTSMGGLTWFLTMFNLQSLGE